MCVLSEWGDCERDSVEDACQCLHKWLWVVESEFDCVCVDVFVQWDGLIGSLIRSVECTVSQTSD